MEQYFEFNYTGAPFVQLGAAHLGALLVTGVLALAGWRLPLQDRERRWLRGSLAGLLLLNELGWHAWHLYYGLWTVESMLPLELCNLMVLASVWTLLSRSQTGFEFIYLLGIPAASQVLITPALGIYGFPHILFIQIFISHGGVVLAALYLALGEGMRPRGWRSVRRVASWTMLYALGIFGLNQVLGSNYLFLAHKPPAATLLDYLGPWPWYILPMVGIGLLLAAALYIPYHLRDLRQYPEAKASG
jgi:hypothetical integral membrane protein (TIGR02206 family)